MTAARQHLDLRTAHWRRRCERLLVFVGVLLPIPLFAASGLSLPLPASVERLAAALVPWADAATNGNQLLARGPGGSIVRLGGEQNEAISYAQGENAPVGDKLRAQGDRNAPGKNGGTGHKTPGVNTPAEAGEGAEESKPAEGGAVREQPAQQEPAKSDSAPPPPPPLPPPTDPVRDVVDRTVAPIKELVPIAPPAIPPVLPPPPPIVPSIPGPGH